MWGCGGCDTPNDCRLSRFSDANSAESAKNVKIIYNQQSETPYELFLVLYLVMENDTTTLWIVLYISIRYRPKLRELNR